MEFDAKAHVAGSKSRFVPALLATVLVAAACGGDGTGASGQTASSGCGSESALTVGDDETRGITVEGQERSYILYVPSGLDADQPAPLVLNHHGAPNTARSQVKTSGFDQTAQQEGIVVAYPDAGDGVWNLGDDSDVTFIDALIDDIAATVCIDLARVYAVGYSHGGGFSRLVACLLPDRVAAVGSIAAWGHQDAPPCPTPAPTPMLFMAGAADTTFYSIEEGYIFNPPDIDFDPAGPLAEETSAWAATNGCDPEPTETMPTEEVVRQDYTCPDDADLVVYIHPGGHIWPTSVDTNVDTNTVLWEFLSDHSTP
jgi:polyhydroxybutyrate depolymerase